MSTQVAYGFAKTTNMSVPLKTTITDGSDSQELKTNSDFTVTSQSLGTFAEGQTITHMSVTCATGVAYAGILRNGQFIGLCQALGSQALGGQPKYAPILPSPVKLVAGDQIIVRSEA